MQPLVAADARRDLDGADIGGAAVTVLRCLAGAWLGVHAPSDPRAMLVWLLERGCRGVVAGPGPRAVRWAAVAEARHSLPVAFPAVRLAATSTPLRARPEAGIASANDGERDMALRALGAAVAQAAALGTTSVIFEPGLVRVPGEGGVSDVADPAAGLTREHAAAWMARRNAMLDRALDAACRFLHRATRAFPDARLCLTGSADLLGLGEPTALAAIFEDLPNARLAYWHDAPVAARRQELLGVSQGEWLQGVRDRLVGMTVADPADGLLYGLPGSGKVDYALLASYKSTRSRTLAVVLELAPAIEPSELPGALAFLDKFGL